MSFCASCTRSDLPLLKRDGFVLCSRCAGPTIVTVHYVTPLEGRVRVQKRRATLRAAGRCINGPLEGRIGIKGASHGHVVSGGKCQRCLDVAAKSRAA